MKTDHLICSTRLCKYARAKGVRHPARWLDVEAARRRVLAELAEDFSTYIGSLSLKDLTELL